MLLPHEYAVRRPMAGGWSPHLLKKIPKPAVYSLRRGITTPTAPKMTTASLPTNMGSNSPFQRKQDPVPHSM